MNFYQPQGWSGNTAGQAQAQEAQVTPDYHDNPDYYDHPNHPY